MCVHACVRVCLHAWVCVRACVCFTLREPYRWLIWVNRYPQLGLRPRAQATDVTFLLLPQPPKSGTRFSNPGGMQGWIDLVGFVYIPRWYTHQKTVTDPNTNQAQHGVTNDSISMPSVQASDIMDHTCCDCCDVVVKRFTDDRDTGRCQCGDDGGDGWRQHLHLWYESRRGRSSTQERVGTAQRLSMCVSVWMLIYAWN